jgi:hypothetical protein
MNMEKAELLVKCVVVKYMLDLRPVLTIPNLKGQPVEELVDYIYKKHL